MASGDLKSVYAKYTQFGSSATAQKKELTSANFMKMMKDNKLIDKKLNGTEVDMIFTKSKAKGTKTLSYTQFQAAISLAALSKYGAEGKEDELISKLTSGAGPQLSGATKVSKNAATDRLTDTNQYTGSHKERFDQDGKGKGIGGRKDLHAEEGYVHGYKHDGTYDKKH